MSCYKVFLAKPDDGVCFFGAAYAGCSDVGPLQSISFCLCSLLKTQVLLAEDACGVGHLGHEGHLGHTS